MTPAKLASAKKLAVEAANGKTKLLDANQLLDRTSACIEALLKELEQQAQNPNAQFSAAQVAAMLKANQESTERTDPGSKPSIESVRATLAALERQIEKAKEVDTSRTPDAHLGVCFPINVKQAMTLQYLVRTYLDWED